MKGQELLADFSPAFGTSPDEESGAFPINQVYEQRFAPCNPKNEMLF